MNIYFYIKTITKQPSRLQKFKIWLFRLLFTENEKCLLNQALNLQRQEIINNAKNGLSCDYKEDLADLEILYKMCRNSLWN